MSICKQTIEWRGRHDVGTGALVIQHPSHGIMVLPERLLGAQVQVGIRLGESLFSIQKKFLSAESSTNQRTHLVVWSCHIPSKELTKHTYYASNSDGGFFRYCVMNPDSPGAYYKGYNYCVTSMISLPLQAFLASRVQLHTAEKLTISDYCPTVDRHPDRSIRDRINLPPTAEPHVVFKFLDHFLKMDIFYRDGAEYGKCLNAMLDAVTTLPQHSRLRTIAFELMGYLNAEGVFEKRGTNGITAFYKKVYGCLNRLVLHYFTVLHGTKQKIGSPREAEVEAYKVYLQIYRVTLEGNNKLRDSNSKYHVYYMHYRLSGTTQQRTALVHIVPAEATVLPCGLDSQYISAGVLVYKIFDYASQVVKTRLRGEVVADAVYTDLTEIFQFNGLP